MSESLGIRDAEATIVGAEQGVVDHSCGCGADGPLESLAQWSDLEQDTVPEIVIAVPSEDGRVSGEDSAAVLVGVEAPPLLPTQPPDEVAVGVGSTWTSEKIALDSDRLTFVVGDPVGAHESGAVTSSRTRPNRMVLHARSPRPAARAPRPHGRGRPRGARFGLVNRWDGLGYALYGGHLRWLPEPAKDLVREGWERLPRPAKAVTVAVWRFGRAVRRFLWPFGRR